MGKRRINAYAQDLSVSGLELLAVGFEVGQLLLSAAGKVQRVERQHDVLLAEIVLQADLLIPRYRKSEIGRLLAHID
jgi:hypothetical protein